MHLIENLAELIDSYPYFLPQILHFDDISANLGYFIFEVLLQSLYLVMQYFCIVLHLQSTLDMLSLSTLNLLYSVLNFLCDCVHIN